MLIAVIGFEIDATINRDAGVICTPSSRFAIPYPRSYTMRPFRAAATLHPGASFRSHSANSLSTLLPAGSVAVGDIFPAATNPAITSTAMAQLAIRVFMDREYIGTREFQGQAVDGVRWVYPVGAVYDRAFFLESTKYARS